MARDGSGTYTRVVTPPVNGDVADADDYNAEQDDIADALTDSINAAGTKAFGANQSLGGFRLTDLATPSSANDAARKAYVDSAITAAAQPLDATLTALAALSWSSGSPVVQFTAADTVTLTLTPSVSSVTASQGAASTTPSGTFVNSSDSATNRALRVESSRATPATADEVQIAYYLKNASSTAVEFARDIGRVSSGVNGAEYGQRRFGTVVNGAMTTVLIIATQVSPAAHILQPAANDAMQLGSPTVSWADLYLASGGAINWNNSNYTLTHSTGALEASGTFRARVPRSSEAGTPTSASANKKMLLTGGATIDSGTADDFYLMDPGTSARTITRGAGMTMYVNGVNAATATLAANQMGAVHYRSSTEVVLSGAFS